MARERRNPLSTPLDRQRPKRPQNANHACTLLDRGRTPHRRGFDVDAGEDIGGLPRQAVGMKFTPGPADATRQRRRGPSPADRLLQELPAPSGARSRRAAEQRTVCTASMKPYRGRPMTLESAAAAKLRL